MIDDKKLVANSEKLLAKIYEVNDNRLPEELFLEVSSVIISINRFKREKVLHERQGKNKNDNPKINIVKLDKNSIPLTVIILPIS